MEQYGVRIAGISAYAPPTVITNKEIAERLQNEMRRVQTARADASQPPLTAEEEKLFRTNDRWIRQKIDFSERRFTEPGVGTADLAARASLPLLRGLNIDPAEIGAIVFGTVTHTHRHSPPDAALLQHALGIPESVEGKPRETIGMDVSLACSTWVTALRLGCHLLAETDNVLVIGADTMHATINWGDRAFACVLGDGGTSTLLKRVPPAKSWLRGNDFFCWMDGSKAMVINTPVGGSRHPAVSPSDRESYADRLTMDGHQVLLDMVPFVSGPGLKAALDKAGLDYSNLDAVVLHEANRVLNREIVAGMREHGFIGIALDAGGRFGNTTSASIALALALNPGALAVGSKIALIGFGGGYSLHIAIVTIGDPLPVWCET